MIAYFVLAASSLLAAPGADQLHCTVETAVNASLSEPIELPQEPIRHTVAEMKVDGQTLARSETIADPDLEAHVHHEVDRETGKFVTTRIETRHDIGEHHEIRLTGTCRPEPAASAQAG